MTNMKKILLGATVCLSMLTSVVNAQNIKPCATYEAREIYLKNVPGYAAKLNAAEAASRAEYQSFLNQQASAKTSSLSSSYTFTIPVVFHVLHLGESIGSGSNVSDATLISALEQVNKDFARQNPDTINIDPLFEPLYKNAHMYFELAKKDPNGNCTTGIVRHYDKKANWSQGDLLNYQYSTMAPGNWNPSKYLNIYIVKNIIDNGSTNGIIVGYTHLPGTAPIDPADAIVYRYDFLSGLDARSLSHEIGHWFDLSHTFGSTNNAGSECGNDDINDTPPTTGFFSTCPKPGTYTAPPAVAVPTDSSDIVFVSIDKMVSSTSLNSLSSVFVSNVSTTAPVSGTVIVSSTNTVNINASGNIGGYSDFSTVSYPNDITAAGTKTLTIRSLASYSVNNYVAAYIDFNKDGDFLDANEKIYSSSSPLTGTRTFTSQVSLTGTGLMRLRVISSDVPVTGPNMLVNSGEVEDYMLNVGLISCSSTRPNIENIMDYSSCPKMFTVDQIDKMRQAAQSMIGLRKLLVDTLNLYNTGILDRTITFNTTTQQNDTTYFPAISTPCKLIADFFGNKSIICAGQTVAYNDLSYNGTVSNYAWTFEGGTPATSTNSTESVTYSTPGVYGVTLTVSNAQGVSTLTKTSYVNTLWNSDFTAIPYTESFENGIPAMWTAKNMDVNSPGFTSVNFGSQGSSKSIAIENFGKYAPSHVDVIESGQFDFSNVTSIAISFDYSYARTTAATTESFALQYSKDCGGTWTNVPGTPNAAALATSGGTINTGAFYPWPTAIPSKWATKAIPSSVLGTLSNSRDVKFRFYFQNDAGGETNNLYIDNINISGVVGLHELENTIALSIFPNPTSGSATVEFTSPVNSNVAVSVVDVTGRLVETSTFKAGAGVKSQYNVNANDQLNSGIYFVTISLDGQSVTKKVIID